MKAPGFFNKTEIDRFHQVAGKGYAKNNQKQVDEGEYLYNTVYKKLNYWGTQIAKKLQMDFLKDTHWLTTHTARFKEYAWCRIFPVSNEKMIFFNVSVNAEKRKLIIKLDCKFEGSKHLEKDKVEMFYKYVRGHKYKGQQVKWYEINIDEFNNWDEIVNFGVKFIKSNLNLYQEVRQYIKTGKIKPGKLHNELIKRTLVKGHTPRTSRGKSKEDADYESLHKKQKALGTAGEKLVLAIENDRIKELQKQNKINRSKKAIKQPDSAGYDILSYNEEGNELHIEVKTTTKSQGEPFFVSINEFETADKDKKWVLYRLYDYSRKYNFGHYYELSRKEFLKFNKDPQVYKCYNPKN